MDAAIHVNDYSRRDNYQNHRDYLRQIFGLEISRYEGQLFTDVAGLDGIATVSGLQYAYAHPETYTVHTITSANQGEIDGLNISANAKQQIRTAVLGGATAVAPDKNIVKGNFQGIIYAITNDGITSTYAIGEQVANGAWTTTGMLLWTYTNQTSQQRDGWLYQFGGKRFYYEDAIIGGVQCGITEAEYNAVVSRPDWLDSFGHPCVISALTFGMSGFSGSQKQHAYILASNGAYFQSSGQYNYWAYQSDIVSKMKQYINSLPRVDATYNLRFSSLLGTYVQSICTEKGLFNCKNSKYVTVYYTPYKNGVDQGRVYRIKEGFLDKVSSNNNALIAVLRFPQGDEQAAGTSSYGTQGNYQNFFNGQLYYYNKWTLDNIYYTHSKLTDIHNSNDGTNGVLGFPQDDPIIKNGYIYQQFEGDKEVSWNLSSNAVNIVSIKKYRCELYDNVHDPARLGFYIAHGVLDVIFNTVTDGLALMGSVLKGIFSPGETLQAGQELITEVRNLPINDIKSFLLSAGKASYTTLVDEYNTSLGSNGCEARSSYLAGRIAGEVILIYVPVSKLTAAEKVKALKYATELKGVKVVGSVAKWLEYRGEKIKEIALFPDSIKNKFYRSGKDFGLHHILLGKFNSITGKFQGEGLHSVRTLINGMDNGVLEVVDKDGLGRVYKKISDLPIDSNGVRIAKIKKTTGFSEIKTFFPSEWLDSDIIDAIIEAYQHRVGNASEVVFTVTKKGKSVPVKIYFEPGTDLIRTAFPLFTN